MKKFFLLSCLLISAVMTFAQTKKVAILEVVDRENKLTYSQKLLLRSNMAYAVTNTDGYEAYDRTDIDAIMNEHEFQRTGLVSADQIKQIEMSGAKLILVVEGVLTDDNRMLVAVKLLDVETAKVVKTNNSIVGLASNEMKLGCEQLAKKIFGKIDKTPAFRILAPSGRPIFLGLNASINASYVSTDTELYIGGGIGFDFAGPITDKFALGFYLNAALLGNVLSNPVEGVPYQFHVGLLMLAGDLTKRPFIIGIVPGTGYFNPGPGLGGGYLPIGIRFGRLLGKHVYMTANFNYGYNFTNGPSECRAYNLSVNVGYYF